MDKVERDKNVHDAMWAMFTCAYWHGQKHNISDIKENLKDDVARLIRMTTQKTAGQRGQTPELSWNGLTATEMRILIGACILALSGEFGDMPETVDAD